MHIEQYKYRPQNGNSKIKKKTAYREFLKEQEQSSKLF
jgi:hypothetical protein